MPSNNPDFHEATSILSVITGPEFAGLFADIQQHGQREPILLHKDGRSWTGAIASSLQAARHRAEVPNLGWARIGVRACALVELAQEDTLPLAARNTSCGIVAEVHG